jgi:hypothetical protein
MGVARPGVDGPNVPRVSPAIGLSGRDAGQGPRGPGVEGLSGPPRPTNRRRLGGEVENDARNPRSDQALRGRRGAGRCRRSGSRRVGSSGSSGRTGRARPPPCGRSSDWYVPIGARCAGEESPSGARREHASATAVGSVRSLAPRRAHCPLHRRQRTGETPIPTRRLRARSPSIATMTTRDELLVAGLGASVEIAMEQLPSAFAPPR